MLKQMTPTLEAEVKRVTPSMRSAHLQFAAMHAGTSEWVTRPLLLLRMAEQLVYQAHPHDSVQYQSLFARCTQRLGALVSMPVACPEVDAGLLHALVFSPRHDWMVPHTALVAHLQSTKELNDQFQAVVSDAKNVLAQRTWELNDVKPCVQCRKVGHVYTWKPSKQTRSGDEGQTVYWKCGLCQYQWRENS